MKEVHVECKPDEMLVRKLEDWILSVCKDMKVDPRSYGLPSSPDGLHDVINHKLKSYEKLLEALLQMQSPALQKLRTWLN